MASTKYEDQKQVLKSLSEPSNNGQEILIPLTASLFVKGEFNQGLLQNILKYKICIFYLLKDNKVTIEYGTGYYVERTLNQAEDFSDRKIKLLKENAEKVTDVIN